MIGHIGTPPGPLKTLAKRDMTRHVTGDVTRYLF